MTKKQQRMAIAQSCGWEHCHERSGKIVGYAPCSGRDVQGPYGRTVSYTEPFVSEPPDYLNDLDAMYQAESELTLDEQDRYAKILTEMFHGPGWSFALIHASAKHRAEAFLKTLGLVDEPEPGLEWKVR